MARHPSKKTFNPEARRVCKRVLTVVTATSLTFGFLAYLGLSSSIRHIVIPGKSGMVGNQLQHILNPVVNIKQLQSHNSTDSKITTMEIGGRNTAELTVVGNGTLYIFSILAHQSVPGYKWDKMYVTGWEIRAALQQKYRCCLRYENGTHGEIFSTYKLSWGNNEVLKARQVVCTSNNSAIAAKPKWASLVLDSESCQDRNKFHEVVYRLPEKSPAFAICGKVAYGEKDPRYLVEWIEYHKYMGASKIVIYTYADLHESVSNVLKYYVKEGMLETVAMPFVPLLDKRPRHFSVQNTTLMWQDEKVPLLDTEQRLRPYKYFAVIDTDEFIMPKQQRIKSLVELMDDLLKKYERGGTFKMKTELHLLDWNKTKDASDLMIEQYGNHTQAVMLTPKFLHVTDRVREGSVWIHETKPKAGYKMITPSPRDDVVLKHFRKCKERWLQRLHIPRKNGCQHGFERHYSGLMEVIARVIGPRIRRVKNILGL